MANPLSLQLAEHLKMLRSKRGWSLDQLATRSGVSRATLSRLEKAEASPTTDILERLCAAHCVPMSRLFQAIEGGFTAHVPYGDQVEWEDPETGYLRRLVSPAAGSLGGEVTEYHLPPDTTFSDTPPQVPGQEHHLIMLDGALDVTIGNDLYHLSGGDCLRYQLFGTAVFRTGPKRGARYLIALL